MMDSLDLEIAIEYLFDGTSYPKMEIKYLRGKSDNRGWKVYKRLHSLGIKGEHKGILKTNNIDDEINKASGNYKDTLIEIKKTLTGVVSLPSVTIPKRIGNKTFKSLTPQEEQDLIKILYRKIFENNGIRDLALLMTGLDGSTDFKIELECRKKSTTSFYKELKKFIKDNIPKYVESKYIELEKLVNQILMADDNKNHHNELKPYIQEILEIIIGHNYNKDPKVCSEACSYIERLEKSILINVLNGMYTDNSHKIDDYERHYPIITLFLENIWDYCQENNLEFYAMIYTVLAHEYLHLYHYLFLHRFNSFKIDKGINKYKPGEIIKESLASYFEHTYASCKNYDDIANLLSDGWSRYSEDYWPYAGAKMIRNHSHFTEIFRESLNSFNDALMIKNK